MRLPRCASASGREWRPSWSACSGQRLRVRRIHSRDPRDARSSIPTPPSPATSSSAATYTSDRARRSAATGVAWSSRTAATSRKGCIIHMFPGVTVVLEAGRAHRSRRRGARRADRRERADRDERRGDGQRRRRRWVHRGRALLRAVEDGDPAAEGRRRQPGEDREGRERRDARVEDGGHGALSGAAGAAARLAASPSSRCASCRPTATGSSRSTVPGGETRS